MIHDTQSAQISQKQDKIVYIYIYIYVYIYISFPTFHYFTDALHIHMLLYILLHLVKHLSFIYKLHRPVKKMKMPMWVFLECQR